MDCTSPLDSLTCLGTTSVIVFPLVFVSWLVGMMLAAYILGSDRRSLIWVGTIAFPLGFVSMLAVAALFAALDLGGVWELLVGPAVVFGECAGLARVSSLRAR